MIRHIAAASSVVLAKAGHVRITYKGTTDGKVDAAGTDDITFSGKNFNDVSDQTKPPNGRSINRVVNGQFYEYGRGFTRRHPLQPRWVHDTSPRGHPGRGAIPDPRKLLRALQPDARFGRAGYQVAGGVRLEHLRAANVSVLPRRLTSIPGAGGQCLAERANGAGCSSRVTALDVWVDGHSVVHRMRLAFSKTTTVPAFTISQNRNGKTIVRPLVTVIKVTPGRDGKRPKLVKACIEGTPQQPEKVWHESCERVRESHATVTEHRKVHRSGTVVSVRFLDIGKPQAITAPSHAIPVRGRG